MNFLTPLFLLGGIALAAPVIFHLIRRTTRERLAFSSLMFLDPSPPRLSRRSRIEHWLLLLLRCLALALLALGFARPFFRQAPVSDPAAGQPKRTVILVDASASMRRAGLWDAAREHALAAVDRASATDQVGLVTFDRRVKPLVSFEEWSRTAPRDRAALIGARLAATTPGWGGTHLGTALITAAESLTETGDKSGPAGPREIVLIGDLQAGCHLDALQAYEWPKGVALFVDPVKAHNPTNAGLQIVADAPDAAPASGVAARVRVSNSAESQREQFKIGWLRADGGAFVAAPLDVYVPPGQSRIVAVPLPNGVGGLARIGLRGDDEDFDNNVFLMPPTQQKLSLLWLGADPPDDTHQPLFFLRRAFNDSARLAVKVIAQAPAAALPPTDVADASVVFVSEDLPAAASATLRAAALAGKTIVFAPKSAAAAPTLAVLLGRDSVAMEEAKPANYAMFAEIDFRHPLLAPFADARYSDFTKIHVWKYRKFDATAIPGARVVMKFDSGDPALLDVPAGRGRVLVLAAGWQPEDSQLAVSSKFVPLLYSLLELAGGGPESPGQFSVGDTVPIPTGDGAVTVRTPAGKPITLPAGTTGFSETDEPGIYEFSAGGRTQRFAVNVDASESRTAPLGRDELERMGVPVAAPSTPTLPTQAAPRLLAGEEAENRQRLWRWFVAATLGVLLIETALAGRTARRLKPKNAEAPS